MVAQPRPPPRNGNPCGCLWAGRGTKSAASNDRWVYRRRPLEALPCGGPGQGERKPCRFRYLLIVGAPLVGALGLGAHMLCRNRKLGGLPDWRLWSTASQKEAIGVEVITGLVREPRQVLIRRQAPSQWEVTAGVQGHVTGYYLQLQIRFAVMVAARSGRLRAAGGCCQVRAPPTSRAGTAAPTATCCGEKAPRSTNSTWVAPARALHPQHATPTACRRDIDMGCIINWVARVVMRRSPGQHRVVLWIAQLKLNVGVGHFLVRLRIRDPDCEGDPAHLGRFADAVTQSQVRAGNRSRRSPRAAARPQVFGPGRGGRRQTERQQKRQQKRRRSARPGPRTRLALLVRCETG